MSDTVTLQTACKLLGGDAPYSEATVRRMLRDGVLDSYGYGILRRITVDSIEAYKRGERIWQRSERSDNGGRAGVARFSGKAMGHGSRARATDRAVVDFPLDRQVTRKPRKP